MFECKGCEALQKEVEHLRTVISRLHTTNDRLVNQLVAMTDSEAYLAVNATETQRADSTTRYVGDGNEEEDYISFDADGQRVVVKKQ